MEGLSPSQFADKLGVQRSGVSHLLSGRNKPSFEFITRMLATYPRLNPDWLIMGTGKAYRDMPGAEIAHQSGNEGTPTADEGYAIIGNDGNAASEVPLQTAPVTNDMADLFAAHEQPEQPDIPAPAPKIDPQPVKPQPRPAPGKRIAQITIFYTDGTYEIR